MVILILGILAAIAIPVFLNQRSKANDVQVKSNLRTAQTAEETYATDNDGAYTGNIADLQTIEPTLKNPPVPAISSVGAGTYTLTAGPAGSSTVTYSVSVNSGSVTRTCAPASTGGCGAAGHW